MRNTSINLANFVLTIANRLVVTNTVFFLYGDASLGMVSSIIAFNSLAVFGASVFELQLAKSLLRLTSKHVLLILLNIFCVFFFSAFTLELGLETSLFLLVLYILLNSNLILSGYLFSARLFFEYRKRCIFSEFIELTVFVVLLFSTERPEISVLGALLLKNLSVVSLGLHLLLINDGVLADAKSQGDRSNTELFDVVGNLMIVSAVPLAISHAFGLGTLGQYTFFRQFFSIGNMIQAAVFRGIWQDHLVSSKVKYLIELFRKVTIGAPLVVLIVGFYFVPGQSQMLFVAIGLSFVFLTWARSRVLIDGHIGHESKFNYEILYALVLIANMGLSLFVEFGFATTLICTVFICSAFVYWGRK